MAASGGSFDNRNGDVVPLFYIAHDDGKKDFPITDSVIHHVHSSNVSIILPMRQTAAERLIV